MHKIIIIAIFFTISILTANSQAYPDRHNTSYTDAWVSCEKSESPNSKRVDGHWIMYDFGDQYSLFESTIWNFNVPDTTSRGMNNIMIDYSIDGVDWIELGEFTIAEAPGSTIYQGTEGPNFNGIVAKYVLISILTTHGDDTCAGMSEFRVNATISTSTNTPIKELALDLSANPNPASGFTMINVGGLLTDLQFSLLDMSGKLLKQGKITNTNFRLNTSTLTSGAYTLTVYNLEGKKSIIVNVVNN